MDTSLTLLGKLIESPSGADWQRFVNLYSPLLTSWTARAGVLKSDCDDLIQEVLIVVFKRIGEFEHQHPGAFRGWLRSILANHLRNYFRKSKTQQCDFPIYGLTDPSSELSRALDREHDEHLARELMKRIEKDFTPVTWSSFCEQVLEGKTPKEVAEKLDVSVGAVVQAKFRVLQRLRQESAGWFEFDHSS
jgi:RNA polymerase sigma-70 factor (ECF subfamily)